MLVLWYGCTMVIEGKLDFGQLTSFVLIAIYTIGSLGGLMDLFSALMATVGVSRRIFAVLDHPSPPLEGGTTLVRVHAHGHPSVLQSRQAHPEGHARVPRLTTCLSSR